MNKDLYQSLHHPAILQSMIQLQTRQRAQPASSARMPLLVMDLLSNSLATWMSAEASKERLTKVPSSLQHQPEQHKYHSADLSTNT